MLYIYLLTSNFRSFIKIVVIDVGIWGITLERLYSRKRVEADQMMKINLLDDIKTRDTTQGQNNAELE